jgi:pseudouridine-5'-phosphate glycosidase
MEALQQLLQSQLIELLSTVLVACVSVITTYVVKYLKQKGLIAKLEHHKGLVGIIVNSVEQVAKELDGKQKFEVAKGKLLNNLAEKKIKISDIELDQLIEAMVKEMKDATKKAK